MKLIKPSYVPSLMRGSNKFSIVTLFSPRLVREEKLTYLNGVGSWNRLLNRGNPDGSASGMEFFWMESLRRAKSADQAPNQRS
ncbi:MAG: hypothetical protein B7Z16_12035 [Algoriphagus sp. 32-45-6]|nr:MAG: hypothetical protein B7Z16_12035 [Algoriphagus sp. 32-45-6]